MVGVVAAGHFVFGEVTFGKSLAVELHAIAVNVVAKEIKGLAAVAGCESDVVDTQGYAIVGSVVDGEVSGTLGKVECEVLPVFAADEVEILVGFNLSEVTGGVACCRGQESEAFVGVAVFVVAAGVERYGLCVAGETRRDGPVVGLALFRNHECE